MAATSSRHIEYNSQHSPVTAEPPIFVPHTKSCVVTLASDFPSNNAAGDPQNFSGTIDPPAACPGPWNKIVLTFSAHDQGIQYDRSASIDIGSTMIWFGTTYEPDPKGNSFSMQKDITEYASLFDRPETFSGGVGNYVGALYPARYFQTAPIRFYEATKADAAPVEPNDIVGLGGGNPAPGSPTFTTTASNLPANIDQAWLEVYIKGNGCDEQWFTAVPNAVADMPQYKDAGLCGSGAYREIDADIDGTPAGVTQFFPYIYTGGIVPTLWRPVPAIGTFDLTPELLNVTPFVGDLDKAGPHTFSLSVADIGDVWNLSANLLLFTDAHAATTSGGLISDTIAPTAVMHQLVIPRSGGRTTAEVTATRSYSVSGWVQTSAGRITTTVSQNVAFSNVDVVSNGGFTQNTSQSDVGTNTVTTTGGPNAPTTWRASWNWPIRVSESYSEPNSSSYTLNGTVRMVMDQATTALNPWGPPERYAFSDYLKSSAVQNVTDNHLVAASGHSVALYTGSDDAGGQYVHYLEARNGFVTLNYVHVTPPAG